MYLEPGSGGRTGEDLGQDEGREPVQFRDLEIPRHRPRLNLAVAILFKVVFPKARNTASPTAIWAIR